MGSGRVRGSVKQGGGLLRCVHAVVRQEVCMLLCGQQERVVGATALHAAVQQDPGGLRCPNCFTGY